MNAKSIEVLASRREPFHQRMLLVFGVIGYVALFQWMYENYLYPNWDYAGFHYYPPPAIYLALGWLLSATPSLWMPMRLTRPSQLAYWVLYLTVFIPSMFVPFYVGLDAPDEISRLVLVLLAGFAITGASYLLPLACLRPIRIPPRIFWKLLGCIAGGLAMWMLVVFRHHLQVVSFLDVYDLRDAANDVAEGSQVNYAFMLLTGAINPLLMGYGLWQRRWWMLACGVGGQLLVYSIGGTKGSILSIPFILGFYLLFRVRFFLFAHKLTFGILTLVGGLCLSWRIVDGDPGPIHVLVLFVVLMRTLSMEGLLTAQYHYFFQRNPFTYYSHIKGVNLLVHYPYQFSLGQEIGVAFAGTTDMDANAHFWATDGIG
ncbi:MAG TPA: hypothetical protein VF935_04670, partial [Candidatus Acidoferrum sp.]